MSYQLSRRSFILASGNHRACVNRVLGANDTALGVIGAGGRMGDPAPNAADHFGHYQTRRGSDVMDRRRDRRSNYVPHGIAPPHRGLSAKSSSSRSGCRSIASLPITRHVSHGGRRAWQQAKTSILKASHTTALEEGAASAVAGPLQQSSPAVRHAQRSWSHCPRCRRSHSGRKPGARTQVQNLLVAELSCFQWPPNRSIPRSLIGSSGSAALPISPSAKEKFYSLALVSGISVAAP